ncbi:MAG: RluA family pseudouridine synthase [Erysipelotrichaceae bacterium]|nr:RluA family pseudouridine synthase [Erysipelotrichaceae bacterium]MDD3923773.1 RluA family pseudouridine synthase [Erysipelotrichaceae bacterium]MDD4642519.1 RluA family pseudouridine synthase [Erysipelotrichaceae bacterium]
MIDLELVVAEDQVRVRIDKFLADNMDLSRSRIQQLINEGYVLVNDAEVKNNYRVHVFDVITCEIPEDKPLEIVPIMMDLAVIYEDQDVIVINKPRGMVVHPAETYKEPTLVNGLLAHCKDLSGINGVTRPGIVHRIDKDTTGLLVVAKNDLAHESLVKQLQNKTMGREYYALVHGVIAHDLGTIDAPIGRDKKDRLKMTVTEENGRNAVTNFQVIERFKEHTLILCRLETGRTHQIRVHMQYIGYPIVGDKRYGRRKTLAVDGQLLHAFRLKFTHPRTNKEISVNCDLPSDFQSVLNELRSDI